MRVLLSSMAAAAALLAGGAADAQDLPAIVVVVEARGREVQPGRVRAEIARVLDRRVIELREVEQDADVTLVSIVVGPETGTVTVHAPGGASATRTPSGGPTAADGTWIAPHVAALVAEVESFARTPAGLARWVGTGSLRMPLSPGLLPWPGDEVVRRETRRTIENGAGLSAPAPSR